MRARKTDRVGRRVVRAAVLLGTVVTTCSIGGAAYADAVPTDVAVAPGTVYLDDAGVAEGVVTAITVLLHAGGEPAMSIGDSAVDSARDDGEGGSTVCTMYLTRPHATPQSPRDGDIYVEGEAHAECASTRVEVNFSTGIEWRLDYGVNGSEGSSGTHYQQGPGEYCSGASRCPRSGEVVAPWGHISRCYETGTYHATTVILSGYFTYRGTRYDLGGARSATTSGTYGKGC